MSPKSNYRYSAVLAIALLCPFSTFTSAQDKPEPDPWFTEERERPEVEEETNDEEEETVILRKTRPSALVKKLKKDLLAVPESNLNRRISLLEEIVATAQPEPEDQELLAELRNLKSQAIQAVIAASEDSMPLEAGIERLAPYSQFYRGDPTLVVRLLNSDFTTRLKDRVSSLGRLNMVSELSHIESKINEAGLASIYGTQVQQSVSGATATMIARKWEEATRGQKILPAESYLIGQLLKQNDQKLGLAIDIPANADPQLTQNISRSLERRWGEDFRLTSVDARGANPEFLLKIDVGSIRSSHTTKEKTNESIIPGAIIEEPNPDFLKLVEKYEKAAKIYEAELDTYDARYQYYIESLDDSDYRQAQDDLKRAQEILDATPPPAGPEPSPAYEQAQAHLQIAEATANSVSMPMAIEPQKPYPHHLKILEDLYLVPSTLVISEEKTPYEYTSQELVYKFETEAPISLQSPVLEQIQLQSVVTLNQNRKWTQNLGVDPRDPAVDEGSYSESEYASALDIFGLEFATYCNEELAKLLDSAKKTLSATQQSLELKQVLMLLALEHVTSSGKAPELDEQELSSLAELATDRQTTPAQFRARCLAKLLSKTEFAHLADESKIAQFL